MKMYEIIDMHIGTLSRRLSEAGVGIPAMKIGASIHQYCIQLEILCQFSELSTDLDMGFIEGYVQSEAFCFAAFCEVHPSKKLDDEWMKYRKALPASL
jgi:hypothetical protein